MYWLTHHKRTSVELNTDFISIIPLLHGVWVMSHILKANHFVLMSRHSIYWSCLDGVLDCVVVRVRYC